MKYRAIIFDLDGTLVDTRTDLTNAVNHARRMLDLGPLDRPTVTSYVGDGLTKLLERSFDHQTEMIEPARKQFNEFYGAHLVDDSPLYEGVAQGIGELSALGVKMAVLTNKPERFAREMLEHYDLAPYMAGVLGGDSLPTRKPDPEGAKRLMAAMEAPAAATLMAGDNHTDLATARRAGMPSVFCEYGFGRRLDETFDFRVERFAEVVEMFRGD